MLWCMRTTIRMDDELLRAAKATAAREGRSLTSFIEEALRQALAKAEPVADEQSYVVSTFDSRVRSGVDLDDNAALLGLMETS